MLDYGLIKGFFESMLVISIVKSGQSLTNVIYCCQIF